MSEPAGETPALPGNLRTPHGIRSSPDADPRRGAVLLMILVLIVVLSAVLMQFTEKGMTEIVAEGHYVERNRLRITAFSALETTLAVMADVVAIDGALTSPAQGWDNPLEVAGFVPGEGLRVDISYEDESGKLPLSNLDEGTLYLLFNEMGLDTEDSLKLTHALLDWMDEDDEVRIDGAESETYSLAEWPYMSSNRAVSRLEELAVVEGFSSLFFDEAGRPNGWFRLFEDAVSPYSTSTINVNSVSDVALRAFAGFGDPQLQALRTYLAGADGVPGTEDDRYFAEPGELAAVIGELPSGVTLGSTSEIVRVRVDVWEGESRYSLEAVVGPSQPGAAQGGGPRRQQPPPAGGAAQSTDTTSESTTVPYPFVFLELTEDVGQNDSLAAPVEAGEELPQDNRSSNRPATRR